MKNSISTRLITLLTLAAAFIIGGGMLVDYQFSRQEILKRLADEAAVGTRVVINDMENWLNGVEATTLLLGRILEQREYSKPGLQQMLQDVVANNDEIFGAAIALNPQRTKSPAGFSPYYYVDNGQVHYADLASLEANYSQQPWFTQPLEQGHALWVGPYFDTAGGEVNMTTFSVPVYRTDGNGERFLYAVVTADVTLDDLHAVLQQLHLGESSHGLLFSREGIIMSARTPESVMKHYSEVYYRGVDMDSWRRMFGRALQGETSTMDIPCLESEGRCTIRLGRLETTGWPVGVVYRQREILVPLHRYEIKTLAISVATLMLMALAVYLVISRLTRPLLELTRATEDMARGKLDTPLPRAAGKDEVSRLVRSFSSMNLDLKAYIQDLELATATRSRLEGELSAARDIQMSMLPGGGEVLLEEGNVNLWARVQPARTVGGDFYTYYPGDKQLFLAVGDVSDKGVPAALFMARAISLMQQLSGTAAPPHQAMAELNNALERDNHNCMFVTLFLGVLDLPSGLLSFASAGHTAPSLLRDGEVTVISQETGPALGLAADQHYPGNTLQLLPGDRLAIFTDGIDEAFNEAGQMFGVERFNLGLCETGNMAPADAGASLFKALEEYAGERPQSDDITLLLLQFPLQRTAAIQRHFDLGEGLTGRIQSWMEPMLRSWDIPVEMVMEVELLAEEMATNIQKYANLAAADEIEVNVVHSGSMLVLEMRDPGKAFDPLEQAQRSPLGANIDSAEIGGLGVHLITRLSDRQSYRRENGFNILRVEKDLPGTDATERG